LIDISKSDLICRSIHKNQGQEFKPIGDIEKAQYQTSAIVARMPSEGRSLWGRGKAGGWRVLYREGGRMLVSGRGYVSISLVRSKIASQAFG